MISQRLSLHIPENINSLAGTREHLGDRTVCDVVRVPRRRLEGVELATRPRTPLVEKAIVPGYVTKSVEISDLPPYDDTEEIRARHHSRPG